MSNTLGTLYVVILYSKSTWYRKSGKAMNHWHRGVCIEKHWCTWRETSKFLFRRNHADHHHHHHHHSSSIIIIIHHRSSSFITLQDYHHEQTFRTSLIYCILGGGFFGGWTLKKKLFCPGKNFFQITLEKNYFAIKKNYSTVKTWKGLPFRALEKKLIAADATLTKI